jgi:hypothetical protein
MTIYERLQSAAESHPMHRFLQSLHAQASRGATLSTKQLDALEDVLAGLEADTLRLASVPALVAGKQSMRGIIQRIKTVDGKFGPTRKMVVLLDNGNKVYSSIPAALCANAIQGAPVHFCGTVTVANDDPHFGFVKFPALLK